MKMNQKGDTHSTNIQAQTMTINTGISYSEAKEIALDVFRNNFLDLTNEAKQIAEQRAEEITEKFFSNLISNNPTGLNEAKSPDFQYSLYNVQKQYARMGDTDLGDLLVDLLVDRSTHENRSIIQIVLNESLEVVSRLTKEQIDALSLIFIGRYSANRKINNLELFGMYLDRYFAPIPTDNLKSNSIYQHLAYAGCGTISVGSIDIIQQFKKHYGGLFSKGFDNKEVEKYNIDITRLGRYFVSCLNDSTKFQINSISIDELNEIISKDDLSDNEMDCLKSLFNGSIMSDNEIKEVIIKRRSYMKNVIETWNESSMKHFGLTSVGIAIGHANLKRKIGSFTDLSIWIK